MSNFPIRSRPGADGAPRALVCRLRRSGEFLRYRHAFEAATGLGLVLRAPGSFQLPLQGSRRLNRFCALLTEHGRGSAACLRCQQEVEEHGRVVPATIECHAGLAESLVPIRVGDSVVAYLQTGQVFLGAGPGLRAWTTGRRGKVARQLEAAHQASPVIPRAQYDSIIDLLAIFSQQLSALGSQFMIREFAAQAPLANKIRQFIAEHHDERLSLAQTAAAMNMSVFHLCKSFRRLTGQNFARYLAQVRIEAVKQQLLNPGIPITQAAFAAGFQSLSQFNRLFRRFVGQSPRQFRHRLRL